MFYFAVGWVYFSSFWLGNYFLQDIGEVVFIDGEFSIFDIVFSFLWIVVFGTPLILFLYQLIRKRFIRTQYYFLKEQKIAYYSSIMEF